MYKKIMVPLDGSEVAEYALPHVEAIATGAKVKSVILLRVVDPYEFHSDELPLSLEEQKRFRMECISAAKDYLNQVVSRLKCDGINIQPEVIVGRVAESIVDYATGNEIDLIILASHGRSGASRWVWGSVADRVLRSSCTPTLIVPAAQWCPPST